MWYHVPGTNWFNAITSTSNFTDWVIMQNRALLPGSFFNHEPCIQKWLTKKSKQKGHVLVEKRDVGVGPYGGGTGTISESTKHHVSMFLVLKCNTDNILGSSSIGYTSDAYRIHCIVFSNYFFMLVCNPMRHMLKCAVTSSSFQKLLIEPGKLLGHLALSFWSFLQIELFMAT